MQGKRKARYEGIVVRHSRACATRADGECNCKPGYQASAWSRKDGRPIRKTFPTLAAARGWRADAQTQLRKGTLRAPTPTTVRQAAEALIEGARRGAIRTRSAETYKPSTVRSYEEALRLRVLPELGAVRLSALSANDLQDFADGLVAQGLDASTVRNTLLPLRVIYRRAISRGEVALDPTRHLELPAVRGRRERTASPEEAGSLVAAAPVGDRAIWATALYGGVRRGELLALEWRDVRLAEGKICVRRSLDLREGVIGPKSRAGSRVVPVATHLRKQLAEHRLRMGRPEEGLVFATSSGRHFDPSTVARRAQKAWNAADLQPITLHECRHTYASLMIAAGVNAKALSTYMGHASITVTLDRYGHLLPGNEREAAGRLDAYLAKQAPA